MGNVQRTLLTTLIVLLCGPVAASEANPMVKYEQIAEKVFQIPHRDMTYVWNNEPCTETWFCADTSSTTMYLDPTAWKSMTRTGRCRVYLHEYYHTLQTWPLTAEGVPDPSWDPHADPVFKDLNRARICNRATLR